MSGYILVPAPMLLSTYTVKSNSVSTYERNGQMIGCKQVWLHVTFNPHGVCMDIPDKHIGSIIFSEAQV
jgi:hypothetical protein